MSRLAEYYELLPARARKSGMMMDDFHARIGEGFICESPIKAIPLPRRVARVIDSMLPPVPRLEDFGTEELAVVGWNKYGRGWQIPTRVEESRPRAIPKMRNRYEF